MTKTITVDARRNNVAQQLFGARRALAHLVEMYDNGRWRQYYKREETFAAAVRNARQAVDHWAALFNNFEGRRG